MSIQTELTRITNAKAAIKAAIEGKGVTVPNGTLLDGMAALIESIEAGGGSSWTDSYSVFATGTFTPIETLNEYSIDTGVPFDCSGDNYLRQMLLIWREPDMKTISGLSIGVIRTFTSRSNADVRTPHGLLTGSNGGLIANTQLTSANHSFPNQGETVWVISDLTSGTNFRAGKPYRWMLLGAMK